MKFLKIFFSILAILLLAAAIGILIFCKTFNIDKYKPDIARQIGTMINRDVTIGDINLDFSADQGIIIDFTQLAIADGKDFSSGNFLELGSVNLNVNVWKFIKTRQLDFSGIVVDGLRVNLIRLKDGRLNIPMPPPGEPPDASGLNIKTIRFKNSRITLTDRSVEPPLVVPVGNLELEVTDFAVEKPVNFIGRWSLYSAEPNFDGAGSLRVDRQLMNFQLENFKLNSRLSAISLDDLKRQAAALPFVRNLKRLQGYVTVTIPQLTFGPAGLKGLTLETEVKELVIDTPDLPVPLDNAGGSIRLADNHLDLKNWNVPLASGKILFNATVSNLIFSRKLHADVKALDLDLAQLLKIVPDLALPPGTGVTGRLNADLTADASALDPNKILETLTAQGTMSMADGKVFGFNLMQSIMTQIDTLSQILGLGPGIKDAVLEKLPEHYKNKLDDNEMPIRQLEFMFEMKGQTVHFHDATVGVEEGTLMVEGNVDLKQNLSLVPHIFVNPELTAILVRAVEDFQALVGEDGRLSVPLEAYNGPAVNVKIIPDINVLIKALGTARIKTEIKDILEDKLNIPQNILDSILR